MFQRWLRFNGVGVVGAGVQFLVLFLLRSGLGWNYLVATALAVEAAILQNYLWHERWTWRDRPERGWDRLLRLARFNFSTGAISLAGNLILMRLLVGSLGIHYLVANLITIGALSLLNFAAAEWWVFRQRP
jgi:putative flippase GtrA